MATTLAWKSNFRQEVRDWPGRPWGWGLNNRSYARDSEVSGKRLRVTVPAGTIDPGTMAARGEPIGGSGFQSKMPGHGVDVARLSYKLRFARDFDPALGGKLPGLCGGSCNSGGKLPNGYDGFSARHVWGPKLHGSVYAYLPTSVVWGTLLGGAGIPFKAGVWQLLEQEVKLNTVGRADGYVRVWLDGALVVDSRALVFRYTDELKIESVYFSVFYGGSTDLWKAPKDTWIDFAEFAYYTR